MNPSGIRDVAGNALDGEFYGPQSASGNGVPGGNFIANIAAFHNTTFSPGTIIGTPHPNDPGGRFNKGKTKAATTAKPVKHPAAAKPVRVRVAAPSKRKLAAAAAASSKK